MDILRFVARPLLAAPFIMDGWGAFRFPAPHVQRAQVVAPLARRIGLDLDDEEKAESFTRITGGATVVAGVCLALGKFQRPAAAVLAASALPLAFVNNPVWTAKSAGSRQAMRASLTKSLGLLGGLLIASTDRRGRPSLAWVRRARREQKALLAATRAKAFEEARRTLGA